MLAVNVIEPAQTQRALQAVFAPREEITSRFCVNYRKLSTVTARDSYPFTRMTKCIDSLGKALLFSILDETSGYLETKIDKSNKKKTAFTLPQGLSIHMHAICSKAFSHYIPACHEHHIVVREMVACSRLRRRHSSLLVNIASTHQLHTTGFHFS